MRRIVFSVAVCASIAAGGVSSAAADAGPSSSNEHSRPVAPAKGLSTGAPDPVLFGDQVVESALDSNPSGWAEASPFANSTSGALSWVDVYVDSYNRATRLIAGVYSNSNGHSGLLPADGSLGSPRAGARNQAPVKFDAVRSGTTYGPAVLGRGRPLYFSDRGSGSCLSEYSYQTSLTSLPLSWSPGGRWPTCLLSTYVTGTLASAANRKFVAPVNSLPPTLSGTFVDGQTLTTSNGGWLNRPTSYAYQWQDCDTFGAYCSPIGGATGSAYTLTDGDVGHTVRSVVTASNRAGSASASSAQTTTIAPPPPPPPGSTALPAITGTAVQGTKLTTSNGSWTNSPTSYTYAWMDCNSSGASCTTISGATASSDTLQASDVGYTIRAVVTASNAGGSSSATSAATALVATSTTLPPANTALPQISGTTQQGDTLTATNGAWTGTAPISYTDQWQDCPPSGSCTNIAGATGSSYRLQASDVKDTIDVVVTAKNAGGSGTATSARTQTVTASSGTSGSCSGSGVCVSLPATGTAFSTTFGAQDMQLDSVFADGPAPSGYPSISQRLANLNLTGWRMLPTAPDGTSPFQIVSPQDYYINDGGVRRETSWAFAAIDKQLAETPPGVPRVIQEDPPFPLWYCISGSWSNASTGCNLNSRVGGLSDSSYGQLANFYAGMTAYYTQGILASGSGSTSYTANTLTDTGQDFSGKAGDCVTATVIDSYGYPDWVTGTIASVGGHTATLTANWSTAQSFDPNSNSGASSHLTNSTPAGGAAYNLAACTPPSGSGWNLSSPTSATPWPVPPSVVTPSTTSSMNFEIPVNEPDLNRILWNNYPSAPNPTFTLTGVNVAGGTLTPGSTYAYEIAAAGAEGKQNVPSSAQSITLPAGDNAVRVDWTPTTNQAMPTFAYVVYGRTSGSLRGLAAVGKDAAGGMTWTDNGTVTPSGSPQSSDQTSSESTDTPGVNVAIWNAVAPAMRAVDPTVGLVGPALANPTAVYRQNSVNTRCVTSNGLGSACTNGDPAWSVSTDYIPMLLARATVKPSAVSMHAYGTSGSITPESSDFSSIYGWAVPEFNNTDKAAVDAANVPVWITEANVDANYEGNPTAGTSYRSATQLGSAWMAADLLNWGVADSHIEKIFDFATDGNNASFMLWGKSNESANTGCVPRPACTNLRPEQPDQQYWSMYELNHLLGSGGKLVNVSGVPSGFQAVAVQTDPNTVVVVLINEQPGNNDGNGAPGTVNLQLQGASVTDLQQTAIDGSTSMPNGPSTTDLGAQANLTINAAGYEVDLLKFTLS